MALWIEVKVDSEPTREQIVRYLSQLKKSHPRGRVVLLSKKKPEFGLPTDSFHRAWTDVGKLLEEARNAERDAVARFLLQSLQSILEDEGLMEFTRFDLRQARICSQFHNRHEKEIASTWKQAKSFIEAFGHRMEGEIGRRPSFDILRGKGVFDMPRTGSDHRHYLGYYYPNKKKKKNPFNAGIYIY